MVSLFLVNGSWSVFAVFSVSVLVVAELCIGDSCVLLSLLDVAVSS